MNEAPSKPAGKRANKRASARSDWSRHVESATITMPDPEMALAIARFDALGNLVPQMLLAQEIARTRQSELTLAYDNVVTVASGFKVCRSEDGKNTLTRRPCVVFIVRHKWAANRSAQQHVPSHLLTYGSVNGSRELLAVPTDVQCEQAYDKAMPQGPNGVTVDNGAETGAGALTCMVEFADGNGNQQRMLMSALHVLTISFDSDAPSLPAGASVALRNVSPSGPNTPPLALTSGIGGRFVLGGSNSFDVQLADPSPQQSTAAQSALGDLRFDEHQPSATSFGHLLQLVSADFPIEIVVPSNHDRFAGGLRPHVAAAFSTLIGHGLAIEYKFKAAGQFNLWQVQHQELLRLQILGSDQTLEGDSGSAVVCWLDNEKCCLLGMHIAGDATQGFSYAIPAWQLFDRRNYFGTLDGVSGFRPTRA